jgi:hypothetical protein
MRTGIIAGAVVVLVAVGLFGALGVVVSPVSCTTQGVATVSETASVASTLTTTTEVQVEHTTNQTERVYNFNPRIFYQPTLTSMPNAYQQNPQLVITPSQYVYEDTFLTTGMNVQVSWIANITVDAYVFNSSENAAYADSNATVTTPNIASSGPDVSGSLSFNVPANDSYFLAIFDPHNGSRGLSLQTAQLFNATGIATFQETTPTLVTQTTSTVVFVQLPVTSTQTTTGTYRRTANLLSQVGGTACSG